MTDFFDEYDLPREISLPGQNHSVLSVPVHPGFMVKCTAHAVGMVTYGIGAAAGAGPGDRNHGHSEGTPQSGHTLPIRAARFQPKTKAVCAVGTLSMAQTAFHDLSMPVI